MWKSFAPFLLTVLLQAALGTEANYERQLPQMSFQNALLKLQIYGKKSYRDAVVQTLHSTVKRISQVHPRKYSAFSDLLEGSNRQCFLDMSSILSEIGNRNLSGLQWVDASGHLPSGLTGGAVHWIGSFSVCLSIPEELYPVKNKLPSQYCTVSIKISLPEELPSKMPYGLTIGYCIPRSCAAHISTRFISKVTSLFSLELDEMATYCHTSPSGLKKDVWFWIAVVTLLVPLTLAAFATLLEGFIWINWKINIHRHQATGETLNDDNLASSHNECTDQSGERLLFGADVVDPSDAHCSYEDHRKDNALVYGQENARLWSFQVIVSGTLSVDTFFLMSGLMATYMLLPRIQHVSGYLKHCRFWSVFILHRFLRLTPVYLFVIIIYTGLFHHLYDGPMYPQRPELLDSIFCRQHWWASYLNNLVYSKEMCMAWSWYLANEFQFSVILAPIFVSLIYWNVAVGLIFAILLVLSSILATFGIAYAHDYLPGLLSMSSFDTIYIKPYTRWGTYAIGLILGWILIARPKANKPRLSAKNVAITLTGMSLAAVFTLSTLYGLYGVVRELKPDLPTGVAAFYTAMHRPVFALGVAIVIYLCVNGYADFAVSRGGSYKLRSVLPHEPDNRITFYEPGEALIANGSYIQSFMNTPHFADPRK
ncbi:unnamed protein product [Dicrocoelium dendriticum]|nr:unnamed protein product [Dicrocoelium dendriticum]